LGGREGINQPGVGLRVVGDDIWELRNSTVVTGGRLEGSWNGKYFPKNPDDGVAWRFRSWETKVS